MVTALADGGYVVAWTTEDGSGNGITAQRFDATDGRVGTEFRVNTTRAGDQGQPVLTALDDGGYRVTWVSNQNDPNTYNQSMISSIDTQRFDANNLREGHLALTGGAEGSVLRVTSSPEGVELICAGGADTLSGGVGADLFAYGSVGDSSAAPGARDRVLDFSSLEGDRIDLRDIDANPDRPGKQGFSFIGAAEFSSDSATGQLRFDGGAHLLYASIDADAQAEMVIELAGVSAMGAQVFML